jgi:hypothetical protein
MSRVFHKIARPVIQELIFQETKDLAKTVPERRE